jgi:hypothetical protein
MNIIQEQKIIPTNFLTMPQEITTFLELTPELCIRNHLREKNKLTVLPEPSK